MCAFVTGTRMLALEEGKKQTKTNALIVCNRFPRATYVTTLAMHASSDSARTGFVQSLQELMKVVFSPTICDDPENDNIHMPSAFAALHI
jgi:hypothetical protein